MHWLTSLNWPIRQLKPKGQFREVDTTKPTVRFAQPSVSTTWDNSNSIAPQAPFAHNMVLQNPPKTVLMLQQANSYANNPQIRNLALWEEALSWFGENLHRDFLKKSRCTF
jgi:hypothetical protein